MRYYLNMDFEEYQLFKDTENFFLEGKPGNLGDIVSHNGKRYIIVCRDNDGSNALIREAKAKESKEVDEGDDYEDELTCPCCGKEQDTCEKDEYEEDYECESCNAVFFYERHISVSWSTILKKKANEVEL